MQDLMTKRIGFIGGGAIGNVFVAALISAGLPREDLMVAEVSQSRRLALEGEHRITVTEDNAALVRECDVVVLAVKPDVVVPVLRQLAATPDLDLCRPLWISLAAGVPIDRIADVLPEGARIVRAMPNTPALVHAGATAYYANTHSGTEDRAIAKALFDAVGISWEAPKESLMDAVTGLSGSGPAFVFVFLEALGDAGVRCGLPRDAAYSLAFQTVYGSAKLALETGRHPAELKDMVTSPAGTTITGLEQLEAGGFRSVVYSAIVSATERARALGRGE